MRSLIGSFLDRGTGLPVSVGSRPRMLSPFGNRQDATAQLNAMGSVGTLFAIVHRTSNAVSQVDWHLYRKTTDGRRIYGPDSTRRVEVTRHLALDVWNKPNPFFTRQEFVEATQQHVDLTGEGWWVVGKDAFGWPSELWCVRPDKMNPIPSPTDFLSGYVYKSPDNEKVPLALDEVIQLRMPNPTDPYRGMGPVQSILTDLDSTKYSAEWNRNFFINSAEPGGIIEVDKRLSDDEFEEMTLRWGEQHQGIARAHRVAILEQGAQWKDRSYSMRDMQFVELRNVAREVIREAFGFPKAMLGTVDHVNRANAESNEVVFSRWLVKSRLERIKGALNNDFLPLFGPTAEGVEFDYDDPSPNDREADNAELTAKTGAVKTLVDAGFDPEEALMAVGLPAMRHVGAPAPAPAIGTQGGAP